MGNGNAELMLQAHHSSCGTNIASASQMMVLSTAPLPQQHSEQQPPQQVYEGPDRLTWSREHLTVADMRLLIAAGALDADGQRRGPIEATEEARKHFSSAAWSGLVAFGVLH